MTFQIICCISVFGQKKEISNLTGSYILKNDSKFKALSDDRKYSSLDIHNDGTYTLNNTAITFTPSIEQCDYASKGKWSIIAPNILEITSENYYKDIGVKYNLFKENKLSQDSLYIKVIFPSDYHPVKLDLTFNNNKSIITSETYIALAKSKYLWDRRTHVNRINLNINADSRGMTLFKSRMLFKIFEENFDTEKYNYLTITLPNFDRCFYEFEPYYQELIYLRNENEIFWLGEIWQKSNN